MRLTRWNSALAAALLAGCGDPPSAPVPPRPLTAAEARIVEGSNTFAWGLLREAGRGHAGDNVFVSPLSVSMALGLTANGARGTTAEEIRAALGHGGMTQDEVNASFRGLKDLLPGLDRGVEMQVANSVWYRQGFAVEASFLDATARWFDADAAALDFADPAAKDRINAWVKAETRGRIPSIVERIEGGHVMFLVNAVYFKAPWTTRFDRARSYDGQFRRGDGSAVPARFMSIREGRFPFVRGQGFSAADLPYGNGAFAMTVVVPDHGVEVGDVAERLDAAAWRALVGSMRESEIAVVLPRLKLEWRSDLKPALQALGIRQAFGGADFSGISASHGHLLEVSEVLHRTFLEVNEEGTEAAAATSVGVKLVSLPPGIYADRPFLLAIRERSSGAILFLGRIEEPKQ